MIKEIIIINNSKDFREKLNNKNLTWKKCWDNYKWLNKKDYYRLIIFNNGEYGLFTQGQYPTIEAHLEIESSDWRDYKPYADKDYKVMRDNGVEAGTKKSDNIVWTTIKKKEFRQCEQWKKFKARIIGLKMISNGKVKCDDCGQEIDPSLIEVHHLRPDIYDCLDIRLFKCLCDNCHQTYTRQGL